MPIFDYWNRWCIVFFFNYTGWIKNICFFFKVPKYYCIECCWKHSPYLRWSNSYKFVSHKKFHGTICIATGSKIRKHQVVMNLTTPLNFMIHIHWMLFPRIFSQSRTILVDIRLNTTPADLHSIFALKFCWFISSASWKYFSAAVSVLKLQQSKCS